MIFSDFGYFSKFLIKVARFFALTFLLLINISLLNLVYAKDLPNSIILENIEKSLLFDKDDIQEINFYRQKDTSKSQIIINRIDSESRGNNKKSPIDILIVDIGRDNISIRDKLSLAYNATLIDQNEVAIEIYKDVLKLIPDSQYTKFSLAVLYQKMNQNSQAKKLYHEILQKDPDNKHEIISNLLSILIDESPQEATYFLSRLAKQNPNSSYILAQLALAYDKIGDYKSAARYLELAVSNKIDNLEYIYNLAVIYDKMKDNNNAIKNYSMVVRKYSNKYSSIPLNSIKNRINALKASRK